MKKNMKRIVTLVLCAVMALGLLAVSASADGAVTYDGGLTVDKTATKNTDDSYTISLEAALKQSACDIVLVVDQSGSMNDTYMQDDGYWVYTEHNWDRNWNQNLPPFGTGIFSEDNDANNDGIVDGTENTVTHQGPYYIYDANDNTYYKLERVWCGYYNGGEFGGLYFVEYQYTDKSGNTHTYSANNVTKDTVFYTRKWVGGTAYSKKDVMQSQLKSLADQIAAAAEENGLDHRIAVVGFGSGKRTFTAGTSSTSFNFETTGLYDNGTQTNMPNITQTQYESALKSVTTQSSNITASINALKSQDLPALHQYGLQMADTILKNNNDSARKKIVVVVTDGAPSWTGVYDPDCADPAEEQADALDAQGATIYTINMMENPDDSTTDFMNDISSPGCYTLATKKEEFEAALATITENIKAQSVLPLDADTQLVDTLSTYFQFKSNPNVRYAWVSSGTEAFAAVPTSQYSISGKTITLNGFAFNSHISTDTTSQKLVVKFDVEPATGFLGGNGVPTNEATSAIVNDGTSYKFPEPKVDVAIPTLTVTAQDKNVYLLGSVTADEMKNSASVTLNGSPIGTDWQDDFVTVTKSAAAQTNLKDDSTYTVSCTVSPTTSGTVAASTFTSNAADINVFKPTLTYNDKTIYLGQSPSLVPADTAWKHGDTASPAVTMLGTAPTLDLTYNYTDFSDCHTDMNIAAARINGTDVKDHVTCADFAVHVLKPALTASDVTIYRGNSVTLGDAMGTVTWADAAHSKTTADAAGSAPAVGYSYAGLTDGSKPENCTDVTATLKLNGTAYSAYTKSFTVHVLQPGFTVSTNDVWADCGVEVDLAANCVSFDSTDGVSWADPNASFTHSAGTATGTQPTVATKAYTFNPAAADGKYTVGEADKDFRLTAAKVTFSNGYEQTETYTGDTTNKFTVHVNTFKLTITKNWDEGTASYMQDTIFTVTRNSTGEILRVVIPEGESSVTVAGLLCGQWYTVKEVGGWSWRCNDGYAHNFKGGRSHTHASDVSKTEPEECINVRTFTNKLRSEKTQWLSGSDYVDNKWTGTAWSNGKNSLQALFN